MSALQTSDDIHSLNCLMSVAIFCHTKQICSIKRMKELESSALLKSIQLNLNFCNKCRDIDRVSGLKKKKKSWQEIDLSA